MNSGALQEAGLLVLFPVVATVAGAAAAGLRPPGPRATSAIQHFAAGVVLAAVAGEVLPDLRERGGYGITAIGFAAGVGLLLLMQRFEPAAEPQPGDRSDRRAFPVGLVLVVGVDLLVDGLLVGVGVTLGEGAGLVLTVALTLEVLFLGLAVTTQLIQAGVRPVRAAATTSALSLGVAVGAVTGAVLLDGASDRTQALVLAFAAAALLWLVVEELLVEAHEGTETPLLTTMFFVGFIALYGLETLT
ncbi:Cation transporter [Modestobacter italicus]|uniref:Cation transporter n=1 Tax=Modestobacter italicus (strain DSM 44449 / CECT 9708 / BC 501) TaxID=2732864 RepID=I4F134_MODI5|nr:ZIP family metal transporter [Modestobacter marinus]CCH89347.1 Cation transporter [Modestobacter marinus]